MASSAALRSYVLALLVVMAVVPHISAQQCNTNLLEAVRAQPSLSILADVIEASGLAEQLSMTDNVTVLAPDNNAFNGTGGLLSILAANNLTLEQVTAPGSNRAASILLYHIVPSPATAADLTDGQTLTTALGKAYELTVDKTATPTVVVSFIGAGSNATVITADLRVCNSVVHIVNTVLLPATTLTAIPIYNLEPSPSPVGSPGMSPAPTGNGVVPGSPTAPTASVPGSPPESGGADSSFTAGSAVVALSAAVALAMIM